LLAGQGIVMDHDDLCTSARIARISGNLNHESDRKNKIAVALILNRLEWLEELGVTRNEAIRALGEHGVRIVAGAKRTLEGDLN
jgi:hypothetical protein